MHIAFASSTKGPLEIAVVVRPGGTEAGLPAARVDAWRRARIGGQLLGASKPRDVPHLEGNHHGERESDPWEGQEQLDGRRRLEHGLDPLLKLAHPAVQLLDLLEELPAGVRRVRRQKVEPLPQERAAPHAEEVAHLEVVEGVLGQGGVTPFLSCGRCRTSTIRVRGKSRWSRNSPGGIQTVGSVPLRCSRLSPRASSLSVLLISPIISFALRACTSLGTQPAASISSTIQYQLPIVSTATGDPRSQRSRNSRNEPRSCSIRSLELTRFGGHPMVGAERSVHDAEEPSAVPGGVPTAHHRTGAEGTDARRTGAPVRTLGPGDPELGSAGRP